jgi:pyruvate-formate lyase-activating enzyme
MKSKRCNFLLELIKPSHYDDDGYVIQWRRSFIPSNSLSAIYGLALDARERRVLGDEINITIDAYDETNTRVPVNRIIRRFARNSNRGLVMLTGVQTNQFARALDIAREFRRAGIQTAIGGFHVSGCLAMLPELTPELKEALALGITLFAGEAEERLADLLKAALENRLEPIYNFMNELPALDGQPIPFLPLKYIRRYSTLLGCFDAGRGCPFTCSFCTIINVQGRKSRHRTADDIEQLIRVQSKQGVTRFFITDDNFARNRNWEPILDRLIELRQRENIRVKLTMQVDTACHKIPRFIEKAAAAGCRRVFIGLESINPETLKGASKGQNRITEYRQMLQAWKRARVLTYAGYILGFPSDTPETVARDIAIIQRELPIDLLEFFVLTPLPGSKDHQDLYLRGVWMDPDVNNYDVEHACTAHPLMSTAEWRGIYDRAWHLYYSPEHIKTLFRRAAACGVSTARLAALIFAFYGSYVFEHVHPLQSGLIRRKLRSQRRPGMPREGLFPFSMRRTREVLGNYFPALWFRLKLELIRRRILNEPGIPTYTDLALSPVEDDLTTDKLELFQATEAARHAADQARLKAATTTMWRTERRNPLGAN